MARPDSQADLERRIRERARRLWADDGRPEGGEDRYLGRAQELIAIEDNQQAATKPTRRSSDAHAPGGQPVEPLEAVENQGEFPGLTDQGEGTMAPHRRGEPD